MLVTLASALGVFVVAFYFWKFGGEPLSENQSKWAEFGDYVGGTLNSVFAFFALVALALTLRVQSLELKLSTEELSRSAQALADQNDAIAAQNFENTFFQMLRLHNDIVSSLDLRHDKVVVSQGRDCFPVFYKRLKIEMQPLLRGDYATDRALGFNTCYQRFFEANEQNLGHYFRHLYRIYKFVDESQASDKRNFLGIVRAQLSLNELALLFYNGMSTYGQKFKPLAERYQLFENINHQRLIDWPHDKDAYDPSAFGDQASTLFAGR